ncbi:MAG: hypothetical protein EU532_04795 [Promethearchaeota archaeon]|nr:MAG: hypothetical protein EU532_04795 [Candidatus Lokiarchaeota archaeon]
MLIQNCVWQLIKNGFSNKKIITISGVGGSGKTTLALYLVGNLLTLENLEEGSCIWIQASEAFPKKRLETLFSYNLKKLDYLYNNIFITPQRKMCANYFEQLNNFKKIISPNFVLPPELKFIVIDNISHHLRYKISRSMNISQKMTIFNDFYNNYLLPMIFLCNREELRLILIHEVSSDIDTGKIRPFFHKLYDRLDQFQIILVKEFNSKSMELKFDKVSQVFSYNIIDSGFIWT